MKHSNFLAGGLGILTMLITAASWGAEEMDKMWGESVVKLRAEDAKRGQLFADGNYAMFIEKAFFKVGELNVGKKFISLNLIRKTSTGVELIILNDMDMNANVEEAYKATGRTLADADRSISTSADKLKVPVAPDMQSTWAAMLDELKWELKAN